MEKQAAEVCFAISKRVRLPGKGSDAGYACCPRINIAGRIQKGL